MHTVIETPSYLADAKQEGMTSDEMAATVDLIATNPVAGDLLVGSGGYRVVTFFGGKNVPVFLVAVLSKGSRANFTAAELNAMKKAARGLRESLSGHIGSRGQPR